ncbi:MAG: sugar phosphate isomerase/epimerase [Clostridia bacterium]|nr:sugar phosphate isomerase/epimerase [Clostridia bacterium]
MMSSLGHDFPFGFSHISVLDRLLAVKAAGFDDVMIHWQEEDRMDACRRFDQIMKAGLCIHTVHFPQETAADLWREGEAGDRLEAQLIQTLRETGERKVAHLVVHTTRRLITPPPNETGVRRLSHAVEAAEKYGVNIALENTRFLSYNQYLYDHISSPRLGFCYDCGHANCYTPGQDPFARFGDKMVTMHLHDNHGKEDEHLLIGEGSIDLPFVFRRLAARHPESYNLESRYYPADGARAWTLEEYLATAVARLRGYIAQAENDFRAEDGVEDKRSILL